MVSPTRAAPPDLKDIIEVVFRRNLPEPGTRVHRAAIGIVRGPDGITACRTPIAARISDPFCLCPRPRWSGLFRPAKPCARQSPSFCRLAFSSDLALRSSILDARGPHGDPGASDGAVGPRKPSIPRLRRNALPGRQPFDRRTDGRIGVSRGSLNGMLSGAAGAPNAITDALTPKAVGNMLSVDDRVAALLLHAGEIVLHLLEPVGGMADPILDLAGDP